MKTTDCRQAGVLDGKRRWIQCAILGGICALVVGIYAYTAHEGAETQFYLDSAGSYYNLLVRGFRAGQLNLKKEVPARLAQIPDPYIWSALRPIGVMDLSYYKGKLYLYFGVTPAIVLFWPYVAVTGHYLSTKAAVVIFCSIGFLVSVALLCGLWRRYFAEVSVGVVAAGALALGLVTLIPPFLARCDVWEVPISCGYMLTTLSLAAIWKALDKADQRGWWLAGASLAYGLAVGSRPNLLFGSVVLLVPVLLAWRERQKVWLALLAATVPISLIGIGLMVYNVCRFDNPFEFGIRYQLSPFPSQLFSLHNFWLNSRIYFFEPPLWVDHLPFVYRRMFPVNTGGAVGILTTIPLAWLALAAPLAWRGRATPSTSSSQIRWFVLATGLLFGIIELTLGFYHDPSLRYEVNFLPPLVLLAVIGILSLDRALACQPLRRRLARWIWSILLAFSVLFSLLATLQPCAESDNEIGMQLHQAGQLQAAIQSYQQALRLDPDLADAHVNLGNALVESGRLPEAIGHFEQALRINPHFSKGHNDLGAALVKLGRKSEGIEHYQQALKIQPEMAEAHNNLGIALASMGKLPEAIGHFEQALRINPDYAEAHYNLGIIFNNTGRLSEAIGHWERAAQLHPYDAAVHYHLGRALAQTGNFVDAIQHFEQALRIKPDSSKTRNDLGAVFFQLGRLPEAVRQWELSLQLNPHLAETHNNLGMAYWAMGQQPEAIKHYERALQLQPDLAEAHFNLGIALDDKGRFPEAIEQLEQASRLSPHDATAYYQLGKAMAHMGLFEEAIGNFEQALQINPDFAEAHYNLGVALQQIGRTQDAIWHYQEASRLKPDYDEPQCKLENLR